MNLNLARLFADAAGLWSRDRDLWLRIAGFYFFVPAFAIMLFIQRAPKGAEVRPDDINSLVQQMLDSFYADAWWLLTFTVWQVYSVGLVLILVLDPARPSLATAIRRALRMLPGLMLAYLGASLLVGAGASFFIVPGLYMVGRTLLTQPILIAEPERGPLGALIASIQRSRRRGWMLFFVPVSAVLLQFVVGSFVGSFGALLGEATSGTIHFVFSALLAGVAAAGALAQALLQAAAYRALGAARQGI